MNTLQFVQPLRGSLLDVKQTNGWGASRKYNLGSLRNEEPNPTTFVSSRPSSTSRSAPPLHPPWPRLWHTASRTPPTRAFWWRTRSSTSSGICPRTPVESNPHEEGIWLFSFSVYSEKHNWIKYPVCVENIFNSYLDRHIDRYENQWLLRVHFLKSLFPQPQHARRCDAKGKGTRAPVLRVQSGQRGAAPGRPREEPRGHHVLQAVPSVPGAGAWVPRHSHSDNLLVDNFLEAIAVAFQSQYLFFARGFSEKKKPAGGGAVQLLIGSSFSLKPHYQSAAVDYSSAGFRLWQGLPVTIKIALIFGNAARSPPCLHFTLFLIFNVC